MTTKLKAYLPLVIIILLVIAITLGVGYFKSSYSIDTLMPTFMAAWFGIFGLLKLRKLSDFAEAYGMYDILASRSHIYALAYPFIELLLAVAYIIIPLSPFLNIFVIALMVLNSLGVIIVLAKRQNIMCACMGTVFKLPMSYVTLLEDLLMLAMAAGMLAIRISL